MDPQERKLQQRIARRKEKVRHLIGQQEAYLSTLDPANYRHRCDYLRVLLALEAGKLPGAWV